MDFRMLVPSSTDKEVSYEVECLNGEWACTCPDFVYRKRYCKHIKQVAETHNFDLPEINKRLYHISSARAELRSALDWFFEWDKAKKDDREFQLAFDHVRKTWNEICHLYEMED